MGGDRGQGKVGRRNGGVASATNRELAGNRVSAGYRVGADRLAAARRPRPKAAKLAACLPLREWVQDRLTGVLVTRNRSQPA